MYKLMYFLRKNLSDLRLKILIKIKPEIIANKAYRNRFGKNINWKNPENLIEKINWLQFNTDTSLWTLCADKYKVREYVKAKGCEDLLNELYGKWDNPDDIEWDKLPESFVLKTNHGFGQNLIVKDKNTVDIRETTRVLKEWLKRRHGYGTAELHYLRIKPTIIAEKLLLNAKEPGKPLTDYKIWCFHGIPESILVVFDRTYTSQRLSFFDLEWNNISDKALKKNSKHYSGTDFPKPKSLEKMIEEAKKLSQGIPQVRIDLYEVDGEPVFGEMTFSTGYGDYTREYYNHLGSKVDLTIVRRK